MRDFPDLLHSFDDLAERGNGSAGLGIFGSAGIQARYAVLGVEKPRSVRAEHFHLTPLLAAGAALGEFYVLDVNRKRLRLWHVTDGDCRPVALPAGVPENPEAAGDFAQHSHDLANRASAGKDQVVHFSKETERDAAGEYQHHFFTEVDRTLGATLGGKPLVLAGVKAELAAYRRFARYAALLKAEIHGNTVPLSSDQVVSKAMMAVREEYRSEGRRALGQINEMKDRSRQRIGVRQVCEAAGEGRVHQLCVAEGVEIIGAVPGAKPESLQEDLINAAAVLTLRAGGWVYVMPPGEMGRTGPAAAILRY